ncbi:MAG: hypothetical protein JNN09_01680 [Alphaproteobacteria bacterium]|nr:hypothetical protein [Alphaproteobacteria bacterium]
MANEEGMLDKAGRLAREAAEKAKLADELRPKLGLSYPEMGQFMTKANAAKSGERIPALYQQNKNGYDGLLAALGRAYKKDGDILAKLDAEMANTPGLEDRFYKAIKKEPNAFAAKLENYKSGDLKSFVDQTETSAPSPAALVAGAATDITGSPPAKTARKAPATEPAAPSSGRPRKGAAGAKVVGAAGAAVAAAAVDDGDAEMRGIAMGIEGFVGEQFPELSPRAAGFRETVTKDPKLQRAIAARLAADPAFKRELMSAMSSKNPMDPKMKNQMRPFLAQVLDNPAALGTEEGFAAIKRDYGQTKNAVVGQQMGEIKTWLKQNLGINLDGVFAWFQKMFGQLGHFFNGFSNGSFKSMRNSGHGMMDAFNMSWKEAGAGADLESANLASIRVLPVTKGGAYYRTEVTKDQEGKDVSRRVMNTVEVRDVTGKVHNVPLSYGLNSTRRNDGNYELTLAARVDETGVPKSITQIVVSGEEGARYYKALDARLRQEGGNFVDQNFADGRTPAGGRAIVVPPPRPSPSPSVERFDPQTGASLGVEDVTRRARPIPPSGPQAPATNDPEMHLRNQG